MNKRIVIVKSIVIDKPNQLKIFDIKIPRQAESVVGFEVSYKWQLGSLTILPTLNINENLMTYYPSIALGELKVQSYDKATIFYSEELKVAQNFKQADFTQKGFKPKPYTHQRLTLEEPIYLDGTSTLIQAMYKNTFLSNIPYRYQVNVYVWLQNK